MPVIRVIIQIVAPSASREVQAQVDSATKLADLLALLVSEYGISATARWTFELYDEPLAPDLELREVIGKSGAQPPLRLVLRTTDPVAVPPPAPFPSVPPGTRAAPSLAGDAMERSPAPAAAHSPQPAPSRSVSRARRDVDLDEYEEAAPRKAKAKTTARRATVRYYTRMNPDRMFPLLVILSEAEIAEIVKAKVKQAQSEAFQVEEGSVVEVEPVLPGCDCYPPRSALAVDAAGATSTTIWVVPKVLGRVQGARVIVRQGSTVLAEVPLDVKVAKQTLAVACGLMSLAAPYLTMGLKSLKLDYASQKEAGFPLYQQAGNWVAENVRPEWIGLGFFGLAFLFYLWMRPKRRDVFWDVNPK